MTSKQLLKAIGDIDDRFIEEDANDFIAQSTGRKTPGVRSIYKYAGLAACAAVVLLGVLVLPGILNTEGPTAPDIPSVISTEDPYSGPEVAVTGPPHDSDSDTTTPGLRLDTWPLTLNIADSQMAADVYIEGHFWHELTGEQLNAVFPNNPLALSATAHYRGDGSLYNVTAYEASVTGESAVYGDYYTRTHIEIVGEGGGSFGDVVYYGYEPVISDVAGVPVTAGVYDFISNDGIALYMASFAFDGVTYNITLHDSDAGDSGLQRLTAIVNDIIYYSVADLSVFENPVIPELRDERLDLAQAQNDPDFGAYLPQSIPPGFSFESAHRFINQDTNGLFVYWYVDMGYDYIDWRVSKLNDYYRECVVGTDEDAKYNMSLYPIPWAESIPDDLWQVVQNPVFRAEDMTLDVVRARAYWVDSDIGDTSGLHMRFSVLYDDTVVEISTKGVTPEQVWDMLRATFRRS